MTFTTDKLPGREWFQHGFYPVIVDWTFLSSLSDTDKGRTWILAVSRMAEFRYCISIAKNLLLFLVDAKFRNESVRILYQMSIFHNPQRCKNNREIILTLSDSHDR